MITVLADHHRKAAHNKHRCQLCHHRIDRGEKYRDTRIACDGTVYTWREHLRCGRFIHEVFKDEPWVLEEDGIYAILFDEVCSENHDLARKYKIPGWTDDEGES